MIIEAFKNFILGPEEKEEEPVQEVVPEVFQVMQPRDSFSSGKTIKEQESFWNAQANWCLMRESKVFFAEMCGVQKKLYEEMILGGPADATKAAYYQARLRQINDVLVYPAEVTKRLLQVKSCLRQKSTPRVDPQA